MQIDIRTHRCLKSVKPIFFAINLSNKGMNGSKGFFVISRASCFIAGNFRLPLEYSKLPKSLLTTQTVSSRHAGKSKFVILSSTSVD